MLALWPEICRPAVAGSNRFAAIPATGIGLPPWRLNMLIMVI
jgi:hypothetical protein